MSEVPCVNWIGPIDSQGYGKRGKDLVHRLAWVTYVGPIPKGMTVDHKCFNRACIELSHLQLLSIEENCRRKSFYSETHFKCGHERTEDNTQYTKRKSGTVKRACKICKHNQARRRQTRERNG